MINLDSIQPVQDKKIKKIKINFDFLNITLDNLDLKEDFQYNEPDFDFEWEEAKRYIKHPIISKRIKWSKKDWLEKVKKGTVMRASEIPNLQNISNPEEFEQLFPEKVQRFMDSLSRKTFELPIAVKYPNGNYDLIAGNTRVTGLRNKGYDPKIWVFEL